MEIIYIIQIAIITLASYLFADFQSTIRQRMPISMKFVLYVKAIFLKLLSVSTIDNVNLLPQTKGKEMFWYREGEYGEQYILQQMIFYVMTFFLFCGKMKLLRLSDMMN